MKRLCFCVTSADPSCRGCCINISPFIPIHLMFCECNISEIKKMWPRPTSVSSPLRQLCLLLGWTSTASLKTHCCAMPSLWWSRWRATMRPVTRMRVRSLSLPAWETWSSLLESLWEKGTAERRWWFGSYITIKHWLWFLILFKGMVNLKKKKKKWLQILGPLVHAITAVSETWAMYMLFNTYKKTPHFQLHPGLLAAALLQHTLQDLKLILFICLYSCISAPPSLFSLMSNIPLTFPNAACCCTGRLALLWMHP